MGFVTFSLLNSRIHAFMNYYEDNLTHSWVNSLPILYVFIFICNAVFLRFLSYFVCHSYS